MAFSFAVKLADRYNPTLYVFLIPILLTVTSLKFKFPSYDAGAGFFLVFFVHLNTLNLPQKQFTLQLTLDADGYKAALLLVTIRSPVVVDLQFSDNRKKYSVSEIGRAHV